MSQSRSSRSPDWKDAFGPSPDHATILRVRDDAAARTEIDCWARNGVTRQVAVVANRAGIRPHEWDSLVAIVLVMLTHGRPGKRGGIGTPALVRFGKRGPASPGVTRLFVYGVVRMAVLQHKSRPLSEQRTLTGEALNPAAPKEKNDSESRETLDCVVRAVVNAERVQLRRCRSEQRRRFLVAAGAGRGWITLGETCNEYPADGPLADVIGPAPSPLREIAARQDYPFGLARDATCHFREKVLHLAAARIRKQLGMTVPL